MKKICMSNSKPSKNHNKNKKCVCGFHNRDKKRLLKQNREKIIDRILI